MSRPTPPPRCGGFCWGAVLLAVLAGELPAAGAPAIWPPAGEPAGPERHVRLDPGRAEIRLPAPVRYAIILQSQALQAVRILAAPGDVLFHPEEPIRALTVLRVEPGTLTVRAGPRSRGQALPVGSLLPGFPGWHFTETVLLQELHYRYQVVDRLLHPDPVLVALEGARALLTVEILRPGAGSPTAPPGPAGPAPAPDGSPAAPSARALLDGDLLEKVRVRETSPGLYEVPATDVEAVLDNAGRVLTDLWPSVQPHLSLQAGLEYRITSAAGDGVLSRQGFTVTASKLAERAGVQVGDTILSVNGKPVDGFASLYGIFRAVRQDPALRTVQVELDRRGTRLTKTYQIR